MKVTIDPARFELFKYELGDEDIPEYMVFENFKDAKHYIICKCEERLNYLHKIVTKDIK